MHLTQTVRFNEHGQWAYLKHMQTQCLRLVDQHICFL